MWNGFKFASEFCAIESYEDKSILSNMKVNYHIIIHYPASNRCSSVHTNAIRIVPFFTGSHLSHDREEVFLIQWLVKSQGKISHYSSVSFE
jgi:hypothetical protein